MTAVNLVPVSSLMELKIVGPKTPDGPEEPKEPSRGDHLKRQQARQKAQRTRDRKAREGRKAAFAKAKLDRLARKQQAKKAAADAEREKAGKPPGLKDVPAQIAHCMMALHVKRGKSKEAAWNICRWAMTKHGYLKGPYRKNGKLPKTTEPTGKGARRNMQHSMEKGPLGKGVSGNGSAKFNRFTRMFRDLEPKMIPKQR